jgi:quercetin dioxygenase-like cupin family protein
MIEIKNKQQEFFLDFEKAPKFVQMEGLETTILTGLHGEKMMMALNATLPGHSVPTHSHKHEQIGMVYDGEAKLCIGEQERIVKRGDFFCIPANTPHSDECIGEKPFIMLDIFYPKRKDFLQKVSNS